MVPISASRSTSLKAKDSPIFKATTRTAETNDIKEFDELIRLREEVQRLTREANRLDAANTRLCSENQRLDRENKELLNRVEESRFKMKEYKTKCRNLKAIVRQAQQEVSENAKATEPLTDRADAVTSEDEDKHEAELGLEKSRTKAVDTSENMEDRRAQFLRSVRPEIVLLPVQG